MSATVLRDTARADRVREAFSWLAAPVCIAVHGPAGASDCTTLSSVVTLTLSPPCLGFVVDAEGRLGSRLRIGERFSITALAQGQAPLAARCATAGRAALDASLLAWDDEGTAFLRDGLAHFAVRVEAVVPVAGRRWVVVEVEDMHVPGGSPLLYHRRRYATLAEDPPAG